MCTDGSEMQVNAGICGDHTDTRFQGGPDIDTGNTYLSD